MDKGKYDELVKDGNKLYNLREYEKAIKVYENALKIYTKDPALWNNKGLCFTEIKKHYEAIKCYEIALGINPAYSIAWANKGISLDALNHCEQAIESFDKAISLDPKFLIPWLQKGICLANMNRHEEAIQCYNQAIHIDPSHVYVWHKKALSADTLGKNNEAVSSYRRFLINFVNSGLSSRDLVQQVKQRIDDLENNEPGKIVSITQTELVNINSQQFMMNVLCIYSNVRDLDELINHMTTLRTFGKPMDINKHLYLMSPEIREIYKLYGMAGFELQQENLPEAVKGYNKVLEIAPDLIAARHNLATVYIRLNQDYEALKELETALKYSQEDPDIFHTLGDLYITHDLDKAAENYQKALKLNPHYVDSYLGLGYCYINMNLVNEAEKVLRQGLELIENNEIEGMINRDLNTLKYQFYDRLLLDLCLKDDRTGAILCIQKGLEYFPEDNTFLEILEKLNNPSIRPNSIYSRIPRSSISS